MKINFIKDFDKLYNLLSKQDREAYDCGPLLIQTLVEFVSGDAESGQDVYDEMLTKCMKSNKKYRNGTQRGKMKEYLEKYGISVRQIRNASYSDLISCLGNDNPILVLFNHVFPNNEGTYWHYALLCGYEGNSLCFLDTYPYDSEKVNVIEFDTFKEEWACCNKWVLEIILNQ